MEAILSKVGCLRGTDETWCLRGTNRNPSIRGAVHSQGAQFVKVLFACRRLPDSASGRLWRLPRDLASGRKCYPQTSPCKARAPCGMTPTHHPGRCTVRLIFSEGNGRSKENKGKDEGDQDFHGDQPIGLLGLAECHRAGVLRKLSFSDICLAGRGCTSEASFVTYLCVSRNPDE